MYHKTLLLGFVTCTEAAKDVTLDLPANGEPSLVAARGYYKDIFQDAGCALTSYLTLPAASYLGLSYDTMGTTYETCHKYTEEDSVYQHAIVCGTEYDLNGALLYPDNEPRYRMMYHNGGLAASHGRTLTGEGRRNYKTFIANGGSYAGSCAGVVGLKGILENGNPRVMDCLSSAGKPENARIGDKQYHHYRLFIPEGARDIKISVVGDGIHNLELAMSKDGFAWRSDARYLLSQKGSDKELTFKKLEPGVWYVSVYCPDTVSVSFDYKNFEYSGDITVLNGVPYTISASWK